MKLKEALDLFMEIDIQCSLDKSKEGIHVGLKQLGAKDEYGLLISSIIVPDSSRNCIESIVKKCGLKIGKDELNSQEYILISA